MELYRAQILLEKSQHEIISRIASEEKRSLSDVVREMLARELLYRERRKLQLAARELQTEYRTNAELMAFAALDGDDFLFEDDKDAQG
ncbi:MAG: hypothetical protein KJ606_04285 [Chloroflexi bacterium]|nr:hypothetical protein [Chloroflexota bacterium]